LHHLFCAELRLPTCIHPLDPVVECHSECG
jgi:hypothetical protein